MGAWEASGAPRARRGTRLGFQGVRRAAKLWRAQLSVALRARLGATSSRVQGQDDLDKLRKAAGSASYTPAASDVPHLVALVAAEEEAADLSRALGRQASVAATAARAALGGASGPERARLARLLDRLGDAVTASTFIEL